MAESLSRQTNTYTLRFPRFTEAWKARLRHPSVPQEAIPPALRKQFDVQNADKRRFRRASSSLGSMSISVAEWDNETGVRSSAKVAPL